MHCAGAVRGAHPRDFDAINVDGTRRIAEAAAAAGVTRLLLLSSLAAREPTLSMYASSKRRGEDAVRSVDIASTVFRPPAVYGPGDKELAPLFGLMLRGIAVVPGHAGRTSLLYVTDLVRAVGAWLRAPSQRGGECFELDDGTPHGYDWTEMIRIAQTVRGAAIRRLDIPQPLLDAIGRVNLGLGRAFHRAPMLTPGKVRELFHRDWVCRTAADSRGARVATRSAVCRGAQTHVCGSVEWRRMNRRRAARASASSGCGRRCLSRSRTATWRCYRLPNARVR